MKPDWGDAPEWANYLAMNSANIWYWHEEKPFLLGDCWDSDGKMQGVFPSFWTKTLEERPFVAGYEAAIAEHTKEVEE